MNKMELEKDNSQIPFQVSPSNSHFPISPYLSPPTEVCNIPKQAAHPTAPDFKSKSTSDAQSLDDYRIRKFIKYKEK
jgi:hypothetical protein